MAGKEPEDLPPEVPQNDDWVADPTATVPGISLRDIWEDDEMAALDRALTTDESDWRAVAAQSTPSGEERKHTWDNEFGSWKKVDTEEAPVVPDPTAFTAQMKTLHRDEGEPDPKQPFGFDSAEDVLPEFDPPAIEREPPPRGIIAKMWALFGF